MQERSNLPLNAPSSVKQALAQGLATLRRLSDRRWLERLMPRWSVLFPTVLELGLLVLVAVLFARPYLDFDPQVRPLGNDYSMTVQFHSVWLRFRECGLCFFWNGSFNGGGPAFADLFPSSMHPLVILTTLGFGVVNGSKLALLGIFFMAGFAQWWLARVLGLGFLARTWSGLLGIVAGSIAGRMQMGWFGVALGTAATALVFPPLIRVALTGSRRAAILLGIALACAATAGQGYMQFGLVLLLPLILIVVPWGQPNLGLAARRFGQAAVVAFLIGAPFLLTALVNFGQFSKAFDVDLGGIQPFGFILLNFVVGDPKFYGNSALRMENFPALYVNYIGWIVIILALVGVRLALPGKQARVMLFLLASALGAIFLASLEPRQALVDAFPKTFLAYQIETLRSSPVIAGLAVLPILGLAAIGIDHLYQKLAIKLQISLASPSVSRPIAFPLNWLLVIPLAYSVANVGLVNQDWLHTTKYSPIIPGVIAGLATPTAQWVQPPYGEADYLVSAVQSGLKVSKFPFSWGWKDREPPKPELLAEGKWAPEGTTLVSPLKAAPNISLYRASDARAYAQVQDDAGIVTNCQAHAIAGDIDVRCNADHPGTLTLQENNWSGWNVTLDGQAVAGNTGRWLSLELPAGTHDIQFRFRPWDGILGLLFFVIGGGYCLYLWRQRDDVASPAASPV